MSSYDLHWLKGIFLWCSSGLFLSGSWTCCQILNATFGNGSHRGYFQRTFMVSAYDIFSSFVKHPSIMTDDLMQKVWTLLRWAVWSVSTFQLPLNTFYTKLEYKWKLWYWWHNPRRWLESGDHNPIFQGDRKIWHFSYIQLSFSITDQGPKIQIIIGLLCTPAKG